MNVQTTTAAVPVVTSTSERSAAWPVGEILRDIARGGFAGAIVGIIVAGLGGRLVMRLAAILVPDSAGRFTENGFQIGEITLSGSLGLILTGLVVGLMAGTVWVVVSPWIPAVGLRRAILAMPLAIALGASFLIDGANQDFRILQHDPVVVAMLIALVGLIGLSIPLVDEWLDRRLPHPMSGRTATTSLYAIIALLGAVLIFPIVIAGYLLTDHRATVRMGFALVVVGLSSLSWWVLRVRGQTRPPTIIIVVGRAALLVAVVLGFVGLVPQITSALGMT
jgi:hypothetical protein